MNTLYKYFNLEANENEFYINRVAQDTGEHEIHKGNCACLPSIKNREYLAKDCTYYYAEQQAKYKGYYNVDACRWCLTRYHKK